MISNRNPLRFNEMKFFGREPEANAVEIEVTFPHRSSPSISKLLNLKMHQRGRTCAQGRFRTLLKSICFQLPEFKRVTRAALNGVDSDGTRGALASSILSTAPERLQEKRPSSTRGRCIDRSRSANRAIFTRATSDSGRNVVRRFNARLHGSATTPRQSGSPR